MKILFFGTPVFAAELLTSLIDQQMEIVGVVTQPDRPKGRSLALTSSPVKTVAVARLPQIPVFQPEKASDLAFLEQIRALAADLYVVVAFGQILPQKLLDIPALGAINVHASLLPKYRGAAPIHRCLMNGDRQTGIAIQKMVKKLDAGDVIAEEAIPIDPEMTFGELEQALCHLSKSLLTRVLQLYEKNGIPQAVAQNEQFVTYAAKIEPEEGQIDWSQSAEKLHNLIRAFSPRPGAWAYIEMGGVQKRIKIYRSKIETVMGKPGDILELKNLTVACGKGALILLEIQPEGKPRMKASDWVRGLKENFIFVSSQKRESQVS